MLDRAAQDPVFTQARLKALASDYLDGADPHNPAASPLFGSHTGLPPLLIQVGGAEVLYSDSQHLAQAAITEGVPVTLHGVADELPHVYHGVPDAPETTAATDQIARFTDNLSHPR